MEQGIAAGDASLLLSATEEERAEGPQEQFESCALAVTHPAGWDWQSTREEITEIVSSQ